MPVNKQFSDDLVAGAAIRDGEGNIISSSYAPVTSLTGKEDVSNKVTTIDSESTDTQYPSAKLLYDKLALKLNTSGGTVTKLTVSSTLKIGANMNANSKRIYGLAAPTGTSDATRKAYVDAADALAEKLANKVTTIDSTSTDTEYPSAKAVYDYGVSSQTTIATTIDSSSTNNAAAGAQATYEYGQNIKDAIVTTLTTDTHLYQLDPGFYKVTVPIAQGYIDIYYDGTNSASIENNSYFQVVDNSPIKSFIYSYNYFNQNKIFSNLLYIWQSTTTTSFGGIHEWQVESVDPDETGYSISNIETQENKVTTLSSSNTDTQYPSAKVVYDYGQDIKNDIVTTLTTNAHLYQLDPGFYKVKTSNPAMDYVNIYYNGNLSISLYNGNYFQVVEENNLKSFYYIEKYDNNNEYYSDMSIIWQSTTNTSVGGYDTWQTISSSGGYNIQTLEVQENKVTTLSSGSTNTEYPSAAAVYTYGESIKATIPSADWDETNSSSKNYIQNKPFYKETITLSSEKIELPSPTEFFSYTESGLTNYYYEGEMDLEIDPSQTYYLYFNNVTASSATPVLYDSSKPEEDSYVLSFVIGQNIGIIAVTNRTMSSGILSSIYEKGKIIFMLPGTSIEEYISAYNDGSRIFIGEFSGTETIYHKLSKKYLPYFPSLTITTDDISNWDNKEDKSNKVTTINASSTDSQYPSAKCVYDAIQAGGGGGGGGIPTSALVTSIDSASTDSQVPSAKCMYDVIQDALYVDTSEVIIPTTKIIINNTEGTVGADDRRYYSLPALGFEVGDSWHAKLIDLDDGTILLETDLTVTSGTSTYEGYNIITMDDTVFVDMATFNYATTPITVSSSSRAGLAWEVYGPSQGLLQAIMTKN